MIIIFFISGAKAGQIRRDQHGKLRRSCYGASIVSQVAERDQFSGQNVAAKAAKELGFHPEAPLGFKHTLFHVVRSELLLHLS